MSGLGGLRVTAIALAALALTALLMVIRFPYDRLAAQLAQQVERQTGARISLGPVSLALVRWAPGIAAEGVQIVQPDGSRLDLDRLGVRPALAFAWLSGNPALTTEVASGRGGASGVVTLGDAPGFAGDLIDVELDQLPQHRLGAPLRINGRADADVDVVLGENGPEGSVEFEARDGLVTHPELPLPMPFAKLTGKVDLGGETWANILSLELASPLASGSARGTIGRAPTFASAPLRLELELTVSSAVQGSLQAQGVAVDAGKIRVDVGGTPARPVVR
jgi:type II secretion system protein N